MTEWAAPHPEPRRSSGDNKSTAGPNVCADVLRVKASAVTLVKRHKVKHVSGAQKDLLFTFEKGDWLMRRVLMCNYTTCLRRSDKFDLLLKHLLHARAG